MYSYKPTDKEHILIYGRTKVQDPLPVFWTASGIEFQTSAGEVWVTVEAQYDHKEIWIQAEMDGVLIQRILLPRGKQEICLFREFPQDHIKTVKVVQSAQPFQDDEKRLLLIHEVKADKPLEVLTEKPLKIEIIGDSLTSGEGLTGTVDLTGWSAGLFGINGHYGRRIAAHFQADFRLVSQSGWGVVSAWDNNPYNIIPAYYHQICGLLQGEDQVKYGAQEKYEFDSWKPDIVIVNLGTNDGNGTRMPAWVDPKDGKAYRMVMGSSGELEDASKARLENAIVTFLKQIRKYNPNSHIMWAYGMCDYLVRNNIERAVQAYITETEDSNTEFVLLPNMKEEQSGANHHPGSLDHKDSAEVLIKRIEEYLKRRV